MKTLKSYGTVIVMLLIALLTASWTLTPDPAWGFWGHRRINRVAVFSLPPEMIKFYKQHIEYVTEHAVDPDKRRYATKFEGPRHFIDIDHWGTYPFDNVPRDWTEALAKFSAVFAITQNGDTLPVFDHNTLDWEGRELVYTGTNTQVKAYWPAKGLEKQAYIEFFGKYVEPQYYEDIWRIEGHVFDEILGFELNAKELYVEDHFTEYGISPYNLLQMYGRLTKAFRDRNIKQILRISSEMGHYVGDAHVPLHTTENYNGQLTDQVGIHAFWESRIPELFADKEYDLFVGKAQYVDNPKEYFWDVVLASHVLVDSVLAIERRLSLTIPQDQQYCFDERLGRTIRTQCEEFAAAYQNEMNGMVEERMRATILAVASVWYSAWIDAGQPDLNRLGELQLSEDELKAMRALDVKSRGSEIIGRKHEGGGS
ncbi:MAG: zinc dependent phospholipase C family protein [Bacteroidota bacterium]